MITFARLPGALLLCAFLSPCHADTADNAAAVDTVTVTAVPTRSGESHLVQPAIVLADDELRRKQVATLGETLNHELGMSSTSFGAGASRPLIRGLGGERVRVLENGIGAMDASSLSDDHAVSVDPLVARQLEVLKGPATLLYGSGAIGGVVNVVTDRIPTALLERPRGKFDFSFDEASSAFGGGAALDASQGPIAAHIDGLKRSTSNYDIPGFAELAPPPGARRGVLGGSDTDSSSVTGGLSYVGDRGLLGFSINHYDAAYGIPGDEARSIALDQDRYDIAAEVGAPLPGVSRLRVRMGHNDYMHQELEADGAVGTTFLNDEYEGRVEVSHEPVAGVEGVVGVQVQHRDFAAVGEEQLTPPVVARAVGVFVLEERDIDTLHLQFGARYENVDNTPRDAANAARSFDIYSVSAGAEWHFMADHGLGLSFTRGQRAPGIEELYNHGPHDATDAFERGDVNLREETANALDITLHKDDGPLAVGAQPVRQLHAGFHLPAQRRWQWRRHRRSRGRGRPASCAGRWFPAARLQPGQRGVLWRGSGTRLQTAARRAFRRTRCAPVHRLRAWPPDRRRQAATHHALAFRRRPRLPLARLAGEFRGAAQRRAGPTRAA
jgi:iron complex outermembrane receptor protein